ncbi:hypothetical protein [uncultured Actinomyces sp.]|uniref:hypothetical protein n=1 Tax=uncultured Actinomyces sp. TaxID=249061 RepID=UPI0028ECA59A|nr:hypothetical protein [uncultured Actinomyces sp.]
MINNDSRGESHNRWDKPRYATYLVALNPQQATDRCLDFWRSIGGFAEQAGVREQLARLGFVGTQFTIGGTGRYYAFRSLDSAFPVMSAFPKLMPKIFRDSIQEPTSIMVAARPHSVGGRPASELWCFLAKDALREPVITDAFMKSALEGISESFTQQGILLGTQQFFQGGDLPRDHVFSDMGPLALRRDAAAFVRD